MSHDIRANSAVDQQTDDLLVRDQVRQEANLTLAQDNLTTTQDTVVPDEVILTSPTESYAWSQPSFDQVLERWYKLATPTWSYTQSQNTSVFTLDISKALFNVASLFDRIKRYRYWRSGVKLRLQLNSTPFHYGSLFAAIIPHYTTGEEAIDPIESSVWALSGQACSGYLSANTGKPLELICPFQSPNEYLDITKLDNVRPFYLMVCVMNPLSLAGGGTNPSLQLSVFAQFTDFKLLGPSEITANSSKRSNKADKEQKNANKQGTLGKVAGAVSDVASSLTKVPVIGSIASAVAPIASAVGSVFDFFGWDKPTNISSQVFNIQRTGRGLQHGSGQDPSETLGLKPDQKLSTEAKHFGYEDESTRSFIKLLQTPMWHASFTINNSQAIENVFKYVFVRPYAPALTSGTPPTSTQRHDYLSFYSQFFTACRGGYRYFVHFDTSSYTTARVRVTFEPSNQAVASVTDGGDSFSRIIDVNGATSVVFEIPYCYPSARMPVVQSVSDVGPANGQLLFSLVNPIQTNGSSVDRIFVNIFRCASDDFRYYQPHIFTKTNHNPAILANSLVEQLTSQTITTIGDGPKVLFDRITEDEEILSHNDFLHRYHYVTGVGTTDGPLYPTSGDAAVWLTPFRAYRGAVRIYAGTTDVSTICTGLHFAGSISAPALISNGAYLAVSSSIPPVEIPYNNNVRFLPLRCPETIYQDAYLRFKSTISFDVLWSAGDDFTVGLRKNPSLVGF